MYPQMLGLASTFQPELAETMAAVLDVARDARWGRREESM